MPSLDPVQKPQRRQTQKKRATTPPTSSSVNQPQRQGQPRTTLMWVMISSLMAVIIIGWVVVLRSRPFSRSTGTGLFKGISEHLSNFFSTIRQPAQENTTNSNEEKIEELRNRVFPEFTNTAE